jgi:hypothetical protein
MSRLTIPEPDIKIYDDGFKKHDQLGREATGKALSELVDRIEDPMVIALDGGWGSGKSFFLKCWVGEHLKRGGNTTQTVYFDAFKHDFMDEPLVSLLACLLNRIEDTNKEDDKGLGVNEEKLTKIKDTASKLAPSIARVATGVLAALIKNYTGDALDVVAEELSGEIKNSADSFWKDAQAQQGVMEEFRAALKALTKGQDGAHRKLVIVVDELDRCRPDYALALLEIIKHFFAVDHVHFVLGVNISELENSVKARYGAEINAGLYLQKFVTVTMGLPDTSPGFRGRALAIDYYDKTSRETNLDPRHQYLIPALLEAFIDKEALTLRAVQRLLSSLQLSTIPYGNVEDDKIKEMVVASMAVMKVLSPPTYKEISANRFTMKSLEAIFLVSEEIDGEISSEIFNAWQYYLAPIAHSKRRNKDLRTTSNPAHLLDDLNAMRRKHLEVFALNDAG